MCNLTLKIDAIGLIHVLDMTVYFPRVLPYTQWYRYMQAVLTLHIMLKSMMACHCHPVIGIYVATIMLCSQRCNMGDMRVCFYSGSVTRYKVQLYASSIGDMFNLRIFRGCAGSCGSLDVTAKVPVYIGINTDPVGVCSSR